MLSYSSSIHNYHVIEKIPCKQYLIMQLFVLMDCTQENLLLMYS